MIDDPQPPSEQPVPTAGELFNVEDEQAIAGLPQPLIAVTEELTSVGVSPKAVVAAALAVATSGLGSAAVVRGLKSRRNVTPAFNLILAMTGDRSPAWLSILTSDLYDWIFERQKLLIQWGDDQLDKRIKKATADLQSQRSRLPPETLEKMENGLALLETARRPVAFTEKLAPKKIAKAIKYCFDGAVFLGDPTSDLVPSFAALRAMEQHDFARMIRASWSGLPPFTGDEFILGATTLFWVIEEASLFPLFDIEVVTEAPMPVLWITSPRNGPCGGGKLSSEKAWSDYIHRILLFRQKRTCAQFSLNVEAAAVLGEFERQIAGLDPEGPCGIARHLAFLPELAVRFAVLLEVCKEVKGNEQVITEESATAAVRLTRWLAQEHLEVLRNHLPAIKPYADNTACADKSSPEEVMQRKIERRGTLTTRELWRSYNKPRAQWFHDTLNSLIQSGKVIRTPDQQLTLAVRR